MTDLSRRRLLQTGAVAAGGVAIARSATAATTPTAPAFHGIHQSGVLQEPGHCSAFLSCDFTARSRAELVEVMQMLTTHARALTTGGPSVPTGITAPSPDTGVLGPDAPAGSLTVTVGIGASAFDGRFGLGSRKPLRLKAMDTFPNDALQPDLCHGDLMLQLVAPERDTVLNAVRTLLRTTRGGLQVRWRMEGFSPPPRPSGSPRNHFGFKDGTASIPAAQRDSLVWLPGGGGEPPWTVGGTYQVVRVIRMLVEFWDRVTISEQERMFGRRKDSGAPLTGTKELDTPNYADDPKGSTIPLDSHIRLANPRTPQSSSSQLLRRAYSYDSGVDSNGNLDMGLLFTCFQRDIERQFATVQRRLADEPLTDYISPVGGGYFFTLPGVRDANDYFARALLT
ncbi:Dyp-type peroxidase [Luteipulveratus mongoliensis]|uniref:Peroxidase n=1 Tax=Luteipulveratus mongoliensis TaxID=571913 RepID=A0A0K1JIM8_9MICO|nr:Dyp-type peroxidase [Luteipulveratus mongoliensis]AKU16438.1 peroxidase [Luteipulveratus mongoliensis]